jgi:tRNA dimethylallyltransferase
LRERFKESYDLLVVLGPTASGKTRLAVKLARALEGEIISADSRQVYRGMDLGTGKDLAEYVCEGLPIPCHLIDIIDPADEFSLFDYQSLFYRSFRDITARGKTPILAGGTGLYLDAVLRGYQLPAVPVNERLREDLAREGMEALRCRLLQLSPRLHNTTDLRERERLIRAIEIAAFSAARPAVPAPPVRLSSFVIGIRMNRQVLRERITQRLTERMEAGMIEEVRSLNRRGIGWERIDAFGLEYRYAALYLQGFLSREEMFAALNTRIRQFAKRQETWFRGMERKGVTIHWVEGPDEDAALSLIGRAT